MINLQRLAASLRLHEGVRLRMYQDTAEPPKWTIGVGRNLTDRGISQDEANLMLQNDIIDAQRQCAALPWFAALDTVRSNVVVEMMFALGAARFSVFVRMIDAIKSKDWKRAAFELGDSELPDPKQWGTTRVETLQYMLEHGTWP